ncbi:ABC transporter permease [Gorillibacterium timonense]|uniref:ABC transporter permease n=1 Tax=Gorillibacterium timonense TaxID=1689269 RepID=UPI00071DA3D9|nr:ABC-2 family transporter protein [Gorillibacterium timonense]
MSTAAKLTSFIKMCWKLNLAGAMEFRFSFLITAGTMLINNAVWLFFWWIYFDRFQVVNGWDLNDVMLMWGISAGAFGLVATLFGNAFRLPGLIATGQLDAYLTQPKPILLHVLVSRMSVSAIGDLVFAILVYLWVGDVSFLGLAKFLLALFIGFLIFLGVAIIVGSLAFYFGNTEGLSSQLFDSLVTFTVYPTDIFKGLGKVLLFTLIPAGFISYMPIKVLKAAVDVPFLLAALGFSIGLSLFAVWFFGRGLRRYTSGNMTGMRM